MESVALDISFQYEECFKVIQSFEYFLDEYVWIEDKATNEPLKLNLWPDQRFTIQDFLDSLLIIILKAHQLGYTWLFVAAYSLWLSITKSMHQVVINSFNEDVGKEIMRRINFILDRLPTWLYPEIGKHNDLFLEFLHKDETGTKEPSTIQIIPATEKGGQSKTPNVMIFDESCWNRYISRAMAGSQPGIMQAMGKLIVISNAIKTAPGWGYTRGLYTGSMKGENDFKRLFLPWWANPNRSREIIPGKLDGKGQPMTKFKLQTLRSGGENGGMMDEETFSQRYPETEEEAIAAMTGGYFGTTLARHDKFLRNNKINGLKGILTLNNKDVRYLERKELKKALDKYDIEFIAHETGYLEIWRFPYFLSSSWDNKYWIKRYGEGADISEGLGQTYSVGYVIDRKLDEIVCRARGNRIDAVEFSRILYVLSRWYKSGGHNEGEIDALICVERTGAGQTTVKELFKLGANQYVREVTDRNTGGVTSEYGWNESKASKHVLCNDLMQWFKITRGGFYDPILLDEASTTIKHEGTGQIGPEDESKYWDCVVAAGCTIQASQFLEGPPEEIKEPLKGWRKRLQKEGESPWTV